MNPPKKIRKDTMEKLYTYLKISGFILLLPTLMALFTLGAGISHLGMGSQQYGVLNLVLSCILFAIIFYKHFNIRKIVQSISIKVAIMAFVIAVLLFLIISFIENYPKDLSSFTKRSFSLVYLFIILMFTPVMEEICCRIIIINRFNKTIPNLALIIGTSFLFALLHVRDVYLFTGTFLMGLVLGYLYVLAKNGALIILIHFFYNLIFYVENSVFYRFTQKTILFYYTIWHYIIVAVALVFLLLILLRKRAMALSQ